MPFQDKHKLIKYPKVTILLYHNILPPGAPLTSDVGSIPFDILREHLTTLSAAGFENVPLADAWQLMISDTVSGQPPKFAVTFDDGYDSLVDYLPALTDLMRPTVFVITDYVGQSNMIWNTRSPVKLQHLSLEETLQLSHAGVDIEFHGTDHHNLLKFSEAELRDRFSRGVAWFVEHFSLQPRFISYAYGFCNRRVQRVAALFFEGGFSVTHGVWCGEEARYAANRLSVSSFLTGDDLVAIINSDPKDRWYEQERRAPWRKAAGACTKRSVSHETQREQ